ncbi:MAG: type IV toxin-antitoxin system AbiEi family antitoxin domain-containing protein [Thermoplasmatota archaeon]
MESIARREAQVISEIKSRDMVVFAHKDVNRFLDISKENTYRIIGNMMEKDLVKRVERGKYILSEIWNELDIYEIVPEIFQPSYIAFWSALHYHGMTDQVPLTVFLVTTRRKKPLKFQGQKIKYVTVKKSLFFGYERYDKVLVSDREKTVIDCLRHPEYSGGISQIQDAISDELNTDKLIEYCELTGSSAVASRLGYLLEEKDIEFEKDGLKKLIDTYTKLDPKQKKSVLNSEWKLYVKRDLI